MLSARSKTAPGEGILEKDRSFQSIEASAYLNVKLIFLLLLCLTKILLYWFEKNYCLVNALRSVRRTCGAAGDYGRLIWYFNLNFTGTRLLG
jgi:hypothetical protein